MDLLDRLANDGGPLANLQDWHVKWLLAMVQYFFQVRRSSLSIDAKRRRIYLHPHHDDGKALSEAQYREAWDRHPSMDDIVGRVPEELRIPFTVEFRRLKHKRAKEV